MYRVIIKNEEKFEKIEFTFKTMKDATKFIDIAMNAAADSLTVTIEKEEKDNGTEEL